MTFTGDAINLPRESLKILVFHEIFSPARKRVCKKLEILFGQCYNKSYLANANIDERKAKPSVCPSPAKGSF